MAKEKNSFDQVLAFDRQLWYFTLATVEKYAAAIMKEQRLFLTTMTKIREVMHI